MEESIGKSRAEQLKELLGIIAKEIDSNPGSRDLASLAKQYREILKELEDIQGNTNEDEINDILSKRKADGKARTIRKGSA